MNEDNEKTYKYVLKWLGPTTYILLLVTYWKDNRAIFLQALFNCTFAHFYSRCMMEGIIEISDFGVIPNGDENITDTSNVRFKSFGSPRFNSIFVRDSTKENIVFLI